MTALHLTLLALAVGYVLLRFVRPSIANIYARYVVLAVVAALVLAPFAWLVCAVFKT